MLEAIDEDLSQKDKALKVLKTNQAEAHNRMEIMADMHRFDVVFEQMDLFCL